MNLFHIHGILQIIIFAVLYPLGAVIALMRQTIGPSWRRYHVGIQLVATTMLFISITLVSFAIHYTPSSAKTDSHILRHHILIGRIIIALVAIQLFWAYLARSYLPWTVWYYIHIVISFAIITGGLYNIYIARRFHHHK